MNLGEKINQLRKGQGMTQEELASKLTVSRQAISKWELGESVPDTENIMQLSKLFGVSTDYLLNDEYSSDIDIPAVKVTAKKIKTQYSKLIKTYHLLLIVLFAISTFLCVIFIFSNLISQSPIDTSLVVIVSVLMCLAIITVKVLLINAVKKEKSQKGSLEREGNTK